MSRRSRLKAAFRCIPLCWRSPSSVFPTRSGARSSPPLSSARPRSAKPSSINFVARRGLPISSVRGVSSLSMRCRSPRSENCCAACWWPATINLNMRGLIERKELTMASPYTFADPRLAKLDGFQVEIDEAHERADIILNRPPLNVVSMPERDQLRLVFETLDEDARVRVVVVRSVGEHFSSGGNIGGFMEATPEKVSKLAWNIASPARCSKPVIVANRGYCFGVGFELSLACDFRIATETTLYSLPAQKLCQMAGAGGSARLQKMVGSGRTKDIVMRSRRIDGARAYDWGIATEFVVDTE